MLCYIQGLEAVLDKAVHVEDGKKITRYGCEKFWFHLSTFLVKTQNDIKTNSARFSFHTFTLIALKRD